MCHCVRRNYLPSAWPSLCEINHLRSCLENRKTRTRQARALLMLRPWRRQKRPVEPGAARKRRAPVAARNNLEHHESGSWWNRRMKTSGCAPISLPSAGKDWRCQAIRAQIGWRQSDSFSRKGDDDSEVFIPPSTPARTLLPFPATGSSRKAWARARAHRVLSIIPGRASHPPCPK